MRSLCPFAERFLPAPPGPHHTPARAVDRVRAPIDAGDPPGSALRALGLIDTALHSRQTLAQPSFRTPLPGTTRRRAEHRIGPGPRPQPFATSPTVPLPDPPGALGHHASLGPKVTQNRGSETATEISSVNQALFVVVANR